MAGDHRVTLRRRHAYRTAHNRVKTILTPGETAQNPFHWTGFIFVIN